MPIYFYEEISFQKPFEDREYIIKVIEIDVIAIKAKTESFQVGSHYFQHWPLLQKGQCSVSHDVCGRGTHFEVCLEPYNSQTRPLMI